MLAGAASAVFTSPTGCPDHQGRLPICPIRITSTSTMYIEKARTMREGGSATSSGDLPTATPRAGRSEPPMTRRGWAACAVAADSWANCQTSRGRQKRSRAARHPIETSAAMMSVSSGPTRFETRNCTNLVGPELTDIIAALVSMGCLAALLRFWRPREVWQFAHESAATAQAAQPRRVMGGSDLPARGVAVGRSPLDVADPPSRMVRAFSMYIVLVLVILIGQMGNLPWWSGHPVGDVKTALAAPANITADFKCGNPGFKLCPLPWIGPDP